VQWPGSAAATRIIVHAENANIVHSPAHGGADTDAHLRLGTHDAMRIMLAAPNANREWKAPNFTGRLYINLETADEVDALWAAVNGCAEVIYVVDDFDYGAHEFGIRDDN
jgi:uncharacterized glyoxalase superfamily protein PhnB